MTAKCHQQCQMNPSAACLKKAHSVQQTSTSTLWNGKIMKSVYFWSRCVPTAMCDCVCGVFAAAFVRRMNPFTHPRYLHPRYLTFDYGTPKNETRGKLCRVFAIKVRKKKQLSNYIWKSQVCSIPFHSTDGRCIPSIAQEWTHWLPGSAPAIFDRWAHMRQEFAR